PIPEPHSWLRRDLDQKVLRDAIKVLRLELTDDDAEVAVGHVRLVDFRDSSDVSAVTNVDHLVPPKNRLGSERRRDPTSPPLLRRRHRDRALAESSLHDAVQRIDPVELRANWGDYLPCLNLGGG